MRRHYLTEAPAEEWVELPIDSFTLTQGWPSFARRGLAATIGFSASVRRPGDLGGEAMRPIDESKRAYGPPLSASTVLPALRDQHSRKASRGFV